MISVRGEVVRRSEETVNRDMATGEVEVRVGRATRCSASAETPPFPIDEETPVDEALRLRYRYLDLRREPMQRALELRHDVTRAIRDYLNEAGFLDLETPILTRSTPRARATSWCPAACSAAASTRCRSRRSSSSSS